jgi:hypothetical protein
MRVGNFSVLVYPGVERDSGYVQLAHGTQYRVKMINHYANRQVDAEVAVDGKPVGTFRLWGGADMTLDGPPDKSGLFTFYARDTEEFAAAAGAAVARDDRGLLTVKFHVGYPSPEPLARTGVLRTAAVGVFPGHAYQQYGSGELLARNASADRPLADSCAAGRPAGVTSGVTGLSGVGTQEFKEATQISYDPALETTISVRLVAVPGSTLQPAVRPLVAVGRRVPPPVD